MTPILSLLLTCRYVLLPLNPGSTNKNQCSEITCYMWIFFIQLKITWWHLHFQNHPFPNWQHRTSSERSGPNPCASESRTGQTTAQQNLQAFVTPWWNQKFVSPPFVSWFAVSLFWTVQPLNLEILKLSLSEKLPWKSGWPMSSIWRVGSCPAQYDWKEVTTWFPPWFLFTLCEFPGCWEHPILKYISFSIPTGFLAKGTCNTPPKV